MLRYRIQEHEAGLIELHLAGVIEEEGAAKLRDALVAAEWKQARHGVVNMHAVTECTVLGRAELVRVHHALKRKGLRRVAYVSNKPRFRGTVLLVLRQARDKSANIFNRREKAVEWLAKRDSRVSAQSLGLPHDGTGQN